MPNTEALTDKIDHPPMAAIRVVAFPSELSESMLTDKNPRAQRTL